MDAKQQRRKWNITWKMKQKGWERKENKNKKNQIIPPPNTLLCIKHLCEL
jgi:hypothetical protein